MNKKLVILLHIICVSPSLHPMQSILDYIQKYGKPVAKKTINQILLKPRIARAMLNYFDETQDILVPLLLSATAMQFIAPGAISYAFGTQKSKDAALQIAVLQNNISLIQQILLSNYDITKYRDAWGHNSILHEASSHLEPTSLKILLDAGANIDTLDHRGHTAEFYAQFNPTDTAQEREKKREIQKILNFYKAKRNLAPEIQNLLRKKAARPIIQENIEGLSQAPEGYRGAHDISGIIKGYL